MGSLTVDGIVVQFEDRVLTHLQIVIVQKLRKGESFLMSWRDADSVGDGRSSAWIHPSLSLYFKFSGSRVPAINRDWLASLMASANGSQGLIVTSEENYANQPPPVTAATGSRPPDPHSGPQIDRRDIIAEQSNVVTVADPTKSTQHPVPSSSS
jgi:hypothetical protein